MTLKTLDNALDLLKYFTKERPAWGVRELAKEMGKSHSIVYRILSTFEKHGFLIQSEQTKQYELGLKLLEYGLIIEDKLKVSDLIDPIMKKLVEDTGESVFLTWLDRLEGICVSVAESSKHVKFAVSIGSRTPLYAGASGKAIMAYLPKKAQLSILEKGLEPLTDKTITQPEKLLNDLERIKKQGWCLSVSEYSADVVGLGVPLFDSENNIIASLTIAAPVYRLPKEKAMTLLPTLLERSSEIQQNINRYKLNLNSMRAENWG